MAGNRDLIQANIRKQLSIQSGQLQVVNKDGAWTWANAQGTPLPGTNDATNYALSRAPGVYVTGTSSQAYQQAKGIFAGQNVPEELIEVLANLAVYYASQTGKPIQNLFKNGILVNDFLATINSIRVPGSQIGYVGLNTQPNWARNPTLGPTIAAAIVP